MSKKNWHPARTGNEFIKLAKERGAVTKDKGNFTEIITPKGSVHIAPGNNTLDKKTVSNVKKWFRLLGLMAFLFLCVYPLLVNVILPKLFA